MSRSAYHDPYREVEKYLLEAQEEIGKAFEELRQSERDPTCRTRRACDPNLWSSTWHPASGRNHEPPWSTNTFPGKSCARSCAHDATKNGQRTPLRHLSLSDVDATDDDVFPRPPSGDVYLLSAWADDLARRVDRTMCTIDQVDDSSQLRPPVCKFSERFRPSNRCTSRHLSCPSDFRAGGRRRSSDDEGKSRQGAGLFAEAFSGATRRMRVTPKSMRDSAVQTGNDDEAVAERLVLSRLREDVADRIVVTSFQDGSVVHSVTKDHYGMTKDENFNDTFAGPIRAKEEHHCTRIPECVSDTDSTLSFLSAAEEPNEELSRETSPENKVSDGMIGSDNREQVTTDEEEKDDGAKSDKLIGSSLVSPHELEFFMRGVESSAYQPPPPSSDGCGPPEVATARLEDEQRASDAVTQTSPQLSRSSSFTWVTECDCSEWDLSRTGNSTSEDSLPTYSSSSISENTDFCTADSNSSLGSADEKDSAPSRRNEVASPSKQQCSNSSISILSACGSDLDDVAPIPRGEHSSVKSSATLDTKTESLLETKSDSGLSVHGGRPSLALGPLQLDSGTSSLKSRKWKHLEAAVWSNVKSSSAPLLPPHQHLLSSSASVSQKHVPQTTANTPIQVEKVVFPPRSQSVKELSELEALEACAWLRAAGFPQYAQMYEDNLFPIDISSVQKDHEFLDTDSIQSLFRRLYTLNKCAKMKIDMLPRKTVRSEDSDEEEEQCALSDNWQFQRSSRRWSRIPSPIPMSLIANGIPAPTSSSKLTLSPPKQHLTPEEAYSSSHDSVFVDSSPENSRKKIGYDDPIVPIPMDEDIAILGCCPGSGSIPSCESDLEKSPDMLDVTCTTLRRSGSERLKDSARALLRRMESLKGKRKKKQSQQDASSESSVVTAGADPSPASSMASSPRMPHQRTESDADSPAIVDGSDGSQESTPQVKHRKRVWRLLGRNDAGGDSSAACSDSECSSSGFTRLLKNGTVAEAHLIEQLVPACDEAVLSNGVAEKERRGRRVRQAGDEKPSPKHFSPERDGDIEERLSLYDNVPLVVFNRTCSVELADSEGGKPWNVAGSGEPDQDSSSLLSTGAANSDQEIQEVLAAGTRSERRDSGVGASLTRGYNCCQSSHVKWHCFPVCRPRSSMSRPRSPSALLHVNALSALQLMMLRKRSLLKLTALMEKYSPSSRTGWNWAVPKFIRRIRAPDYKDKVVFGVPLVVNIQRTGHPLPPSIQAAIRHLRKTALDSTGLFRKSGVRSRIQKLRNLNESNPDSVSYENQQSYDVADMLKQYFRELPEALLTNKLSETFISIFQYIPQDLRLQAIQAAVLLMPDENREVLQALLSFLREVCEHSAENQMTASNLAVCFAPSLFHLSTPRSASASPRRRKTVGVPDQRELNENRAAHECLTRMIVDYSYLFQLSEDVLLNSRASDHSDPASLDELGTCPVRGHCSWKAYVEGCIQALLKETREKLKGWVVVPQNDSAEVSYKKVGDGFPLRLWKVSVDVEAPPVELLSRVLRERHLWDEGLLKWRLVTKLDKQSEVFQYVCYSLPPHPPRNYCVLRSWRTDLPKGTCVLIEASVDHPDAPVLLDGIRGMVLASRYLIEPCGAGKSRVTHISRVDMRGRSPDWYNKSYGHLAAMLMIRLRDSFKHGTDGPETKV